MISSSRSYHIFHTTPFEYNLYNLNTRPKLATKIDVCPHETWKVLKTHTSAKQNTTHTIYSRRVDFSHCRPTNLYNARNSNRTQPATHSSPSQPVRTWLRPLWYSRTAAVRKIRSVSGYGATKRLWLAGNSIAGTLACMLFVICYPSVRTVPLVSGVTWCGWYCTIRQWKRWWQRLE